MIRHVHISRIGAVRAWRDAARALLAAGIPPEQVAFGASERSLFSEPCEDLPPAPNARLKLAKSALDTIETALCHSDPARFDRAYTILWRLQARRVRFGDRSDPQMRKLMAQAKEVRRDIHKMHAFVRFREGPAQSDRRAFAAWFEPEHHCVEAAAPFFAKRFGDMDWMIKTPLITAVFKAGGLSFVETDDPTPPPEDATEALWCGYYAAIFNPARIKLSAMQSEMPQKYWKNLPETRQIATLLRDAPARVDAMRAAQPSQPPAFAKALLRRNQEPPAQAQGAPSGCLVDPACERCALGASATQLVAGEGPLDADIMIVGEQPGDQEDLTGRPFVGPAGQVLNQTLERIGGCRERAYLTNAVKHFKFVARGKRRIHQRPDSGEVEACRWWLDLEISRVQPKLIVALGATAAFALTGSGQRLTQRQGMIEPGRAGIPVLITTHPAYLLRLQDTATKQRATDAFEAGLRQAFDIADRLDMPPSAEAPTQGQLL